MIVIVGASGLVGSRLYNSIRQAYPNTVGTHLKTPSVKGTYHTTPAPNLIHFDINKMSLKDLDIDWHWVTHLVVSVASSTKLDQVRMDWDRNPRISYQQNVVDVLRLVKFCREWNIVVVFLSSDGVFDGHKGNYSEEHRPNPIHRYGVYKAAIEASVRTTSDQHLIFRFGQVLDDDLGSETLLVEMVDSLRQNKPISLAYDQIITPIHVNHLVEGISTIVHQGFTGTFHLASLPAMSRYDLGIQVATYLDISHKLVKPIKLETLQLLEKRALRTDLNINKFCSVTGFERKTVSNLLDRLDLSQS